MGGKVQSTVMQNSISMHQTAVIPQETGRLFELLDNFFKFLCICLWFSRLVCTYTNTKIPRVRRSLGLREVGWESASCLCCSKIWNVHFWIKIHLMEIFFLLCCLSKTASVSLQQQAKKYHRQCSSCWPVSLGIRLASVLGWENIPLKFSIEHPDSTTDCKFCILVC